MPVAKKPNYDFEKRRKEIDRKQKKDAKREERLERRRSGAPDDGTDEVAAVTDGAVSDPRDGGAV